MSVASQEGTQESDVTVTGEPGEIVTVEAPDPEDEGGGERETGGEPVREDRKTRRANRMRDEQTARQEAERQTASERAERGRLEREVAELRGFVAARAAREDRGTSTSDVTTQVDRLETEAQEHLQRSALAAKAGDMAMAARELKAFNAKNREAARIETVAALQPDFERRINEVRGNIPTPEIVAARENILQEFSWIRTDPEARSMVDVKFETLKTAGRPGTYETIREAAAYVAKRLKLGGRQDPTQESRARLQAVPSGEGAGGGEGSVQIVMDEKNKKLAHAAYRNLEPKEAERAFAREMAGAKRRGEW